MNQRIMLGLAFQMVGGGTPATNKEEYWGDGKNGFPWISSADIDLRGNIRPRRTVSETGIRESAANIVPSDTIVVVTRVGLGKVAILPSDMCFSQDIQALLPRTVSEYNSRFLLYQISYKMQHLKYWGPGTTISGITKKQLGDVDLFFPPLPEQERIVARIEELFSQLDNGVETLKKTKQQLAVYRQAVLKDAFNRIKSRGSLLPIRDVCKDIKVGIVIKPSQYYTDSSRGIKAFRSANVREFHIFDSDWVYLSKEGHEANKRSEIHTGDVLIVRSGYPGTACVVNERFDGCNAIDILIAVPDTEKVLPEYLCAYTNSPYGRKLVSEKKSGVAQAHLNVGGYSKMEIMLPTIEEQKEVVLSIESRLSIYEEISQTIDTALQQVEALRQSILKRAFEGGI